MLFYCKLLKYVKLVNLELVLPQRMFKICESFDRVVDKKSRKNKTARHV